MNAVETIYPPDRVTLREAGLRDGLQLAKNWPDTAAKSAWIEAEYAAGIRHFEVGSFLPEAKFPQFADVRQVIAATAALPGAHGVALAMNVRGAEAAIASGVPEIACVVSATEAHSTRNARRTMAEALATVREIGALRDAAAHRPLVSVGIAMAFGCSIAGEVAPGAVLRLVEMIAEAGADVIALADTVGFAGPDQVSRLTAASLSLVGDIPLGIHLHDTRGLGLVNASAAIDAGARIVDASIGGLGGCPFAPRATGNIVMEDLAFLCQTKGLETGIDIERLIAVREIVAAAMPGETLHGAMARAGLPTAELAGA
ncbi:hydroxymethylglutaryl-CoA lyase [Oceanibacterium hippocampi]|uniref:Hydroxymethylglutaryl-CoA lyase YngG n=1 Tax=Oceanibacterium hippocampi TaxID=745714 RepID=A0A1Y5S4K3_9PROT|nr:hydroxymethylglutaryl-CoA lyase [Oceanibacterium hippocampi]SLN32453.1 Hydroxymethylglutaryl-CoA lyase YngG [Oceanibacterium hippocampi]